MPSLRESTLANGSNESRKKTIENGSHAAATTLSRRVWRCLNEPMQGKREMAVYVVGFLVVGLAGFIDVAAGEGYPLWQAPMLVLGVVGAIYLLLRYRH